jgi:alpha-tubulin suppressor-like RCC1 family protein
LGHGDSNNQFSPKLVQYLDAQTTIIQLSCGLYHVMAVSGNNRVYAWGMGQMTPKLVDSLDTKGITEVACGEYESLALTRKNHENSLKFTL